VLLVICQFQEIYIRNFVLSILFVSQSVCCTNMTFSIFYVFKRGENTFQTASRPVLSFLLHDSSIVIKTFWTKRCDVKTKTFVTMTNRTRHGFCFEIAKRQISSSAVVQVLPADFLKYSWKNTIEFHELFVLLSFSCESLLQIVIKKKSCCSKCATVANQHAIKPSHCKVVLHEVSVAVTRRTRDRSV